MKDLLYQLYETSVQMLRTIEEISIENKMLDDQHYLCWKDSLNVLSLDPDRE